MAAPTPPGPPPPSPEAPHRDRPRGGTALLIIDMINDFDFAGGEALRPRAEAAAAAILRLRDAAAAAEMPVVYINDHFGEWHSERTRIVERARAGGNPLVERLRPRDDDYFIIKPQFSGFYATNLPVLLPKLGVSRLVLTGVATDICVLFTAADAHMRDYALWVPEDAVAAEDTARGAAALSILRETMAAETRPSDALTLADWGRALDAARAR